MTVKNIKKLVLYWHRGSRYDFKTAQSLYEKKRYPYSLFFCHLAVEKLLKALVVKATGDHAPPTHNLLVLAGKSGIELTKKIESGLTELGKFNIEARYPDYTMDLYKRADQSYTREHLKMTKELLKWLRNQSGE